MRRSSRIQDMEIHHRNLNILMKYKNGFAPTWDVYVRWPGHKNRKYFCLIPAWNRLPSSCIDLVREKIDAELGLAWIDITTADFGTHRYQIERVNSDGNLIFKQREILNNRYLRFNQKEERVEELISESDGKWDVYISDSSIIQVDFWNSDTRR